MSDSRSRDGPGGLARRRAVEEGVRVELTTAVHQATVTVFKAAGLTTCPDPPWRTLPRSTVAGRLLRAIAASSLREQTRRVSNPLPPR